MKTNKTLMALAAMSILGAASAHAQNTQHAQSDLVLTFQNPGGTTGAAQTVTVALGNVSTVFRDATPGSVFFPNAVNIATLGTTLTNTFGANWFEQTTLYMGAIGFRGTAVSNTLFNSDPSQTLYYTKARDTLGSPGVQNAATPTIISNAGSGIVDGMNQVKQQIEQFGTTAIFVQGTGTSFIDDQNPFTGGNPANGQATAYADIAGGVQDNFSVGTLGVFGTAGPVEIALDLFRVQTRNDVAGQNGFGEPVNTGDFLGTITLNDAGQVAFSAVPEPTTTALLALGAAGLIARRRRCQS